MIFFQFCFNSCHLRLISLDIFSISTTAWTRVYVCEKPPPLIVESSFEHSCVSNCHLNDT